MSSSFKIDAKTRKLQIAASKDSTRYNINGVFFNNGKFAAATDGHILAIQDLTKSLSEVEGARILEFSNPKQKEDVEEFYPLKNKFASETGCIVDEKKDGSFPDVTNVIPHSFDKPARVSLDVKLLVRLAAALSDNALSYVTLEFDSDDKRYGPVIVKGTDESKIGLIMPLRQEAKDLLKEAQTLIKK